MDIDNKLDVLNRIYEIYDKFASGLHVSCKRYCADCCTLNVTLTTMEGYKIIEDMTPGERTDLLETMGEGLGRKRFKPLVTINGLADICMKGEEPPEEESDPSWGSCPFLKDNECSIYTVRPFGCRCMVSKQDCRETGYADMDPFVLTVNNVFLQFIEHLDDAGFTGNLTDVMMVAASGENPDDCLKVRQGKSDIHLVANTPMKVLMIPPGHRVRIGPILVALRRELQNPR